MSLVRLKQKMRVAIRPLMWVIAGIFVLSCFTFYGNYNTSGGAAPASHLFAKVNGEDVPMGQFATALDREREMVRRFSDMGGTAATMDQQVETPRRAYEGILDQYAQAAA